MPTPPLADLSAVVIAKDETDRLARCLETAAQVAGEMVVVVDAESRPDTAAVARARGARVFVEPWRGFSAQKNWGMDRASGEWMLSLDADEELSPELIEEILRVAASPDARDAYRMPRRTWFLGRWIGHSGWYPDAQLRLFRKGAGRFNEGKRVHEGVVLAPGASLGTLRGELRHFPYERLEEYVEKLDRYTALAAEDLRTRGVRFRAWQLATEPSWTWIRSFLLKQGFRDGRQGWAIASLSAMNTFFKYAKLWELERGEHAGRAKA